MQHYKTTFLLQVDKMHTPPIIKGIVLLIACLFYSNYCLAGSDADDWAKITHPGHSLKTQSIGSYTNGCVSGAASLPLQGNGYQVMRLSRHRYYGHPNLINFIQQYGQSVADAQLGAVLIGDLGQPRGGPTLSGHRSHQTGLDVDIWFLLAPQASQRQLTIAERETWSAPSLVNLKTDALAPQWSTTHAQMLELAAKQPEVDRIFVNPSIKRGLCQRKTSNSAAWLRKIRPWWKHDDHFHVRLKCPANDQNCQDQEPLPGGDGCDASLAWWFSAEAKAPAKSITPPQPQPPLPALCEQLLTE
jgi:penicillin-insensitive murein endopeptidase